MSLIITEEQRGRKNIYHLKRLNDAGVPISDEEYRIGMEVRTIIKKNDHGVVSMEIKKGEHPGGETVIVIVDENGLMNEDAYEYINNIRAVGGNTQKAMGYAIGTYLMFMRMSGYDYKKPTYQNVEEFRNFLTGRKTTPEPGSKVTYRQPVSCNNYMSFAKNFLLLTKNDCSAFEEIENRGQQTRTYTDIYGRRRIMGSKRNPHRVKKDPLSGKELPAHPKPEQVKAILIDAKKMYFPSIFWGIQTQFRTGVRRGGLLGLTIEDLVEEHNGDDVEYFLYLRNRISDNPDQCCKTLYHPYDADEYKSELYRSSTQRIHISKKLYDGLMNYYRSSRDEKIVGSRKRRLILQNTKADSIYGKGHINYYIFIHPNGNRLSGQTYNNHLKPLFKKHGVTLDHGVKLYNVSHQLRSAFLMFRGRYSENPETLLQLARDAGHSSPESTLCYFNEFPEDIRARWEQFDNELDELIPDTENITPEIA